MHRSAVIFAVLVFVGSCYAAILEPVPCVDLVDGLDVNGTFSDPVFIAGQGFGYFNRSVLNNDNGTDTVSLPYEGFLWNWDSHSYYANYPQRAPVLRHGGSSDYNFWNYFAPMVNGEEFTNNYGSLLRTCGQDNETFVDGPGPIMPQVKGRWPTFNIAPYNITFWQQIYIPNEPTSNWARAVHFFKRPRRSRSFTGRAATTNKMSSSYIPIALWIVIVYSKSDMMRKFSVLMTLISSTDLDQMTYLRMPTAVNFMGKNGRVIVRGADTQNCDMLSTSADTFKLKAGETVAFAYFANLGFDLNQTMSTAQWIDSQPAEAFAKLTDDELSQIMNWDACAAVLSSQVSVNVTQSDKCAKTATLSIVVTSQLKYPATHRVVNAEGDVVQQVSGSSFELTQSGSFVLETLMNNCVVKRTNFDAVVNDALLDTNKGTVSGSNGPFTFSVQSNKLTITDANGCQVEATIATTVKTSQASLSIVGSATLAILAIAMF